jgi:hypothetical protein
MRHLFYWLHAILALIGLGVCGVLLTATSGHPPGVVFLPLAVAAWLVAHAFLGLLQLLVVMGRSRLERMDGEPASWPLLLILIVTVFSLTFLYMLAGLVEWALSGEAMGTRRLVYIALQLAVFISLCGILLRMNWGRLMVAAMSLLLALYVLVRAVPEVFSSNQIGIGMSFYLASLVGGLVAVSYQLLMSQRIKSFFIRG